MSEENKESNPVSPEPCVPAQASSPAVPSLAASEAAKPASENPAEPVAAKSQPVQAAAAPPSGEKPGAAAPQSVAPAVATAAAAGTAKPVASAPAKPVPPKPEVPKPQPWDSDLVRSLKAQYGSGIREASIYAKQNYLVVGSSIVYGILLRMQDELFDYCVDITAVHYPKREAQFDVVYVLYSFHKNERIRIKTQIKDGEPLRSAVALWPTANWLEREVFDMFGITFDGHPELKRILMPEAWKGHPLRKDYAILQLDQEWVKTNIGIENAQ
jgi:NADH-quinone oxidoreductase subunit C